METTAAQAPVQDLGYANGWGDNVPTAVQACRAMGHRLQVQALGQQGTLDEYTCPVCRYFYLVDSSG